MGLYVVDVKQKHARSTSSVTTQWCDLKYGRFCGYLPEATLRGGWLWGATIRRTLRQPDRKLTRLTC